MTVWPICSNITRLSAHEHVAVGYGPGRDGRNLDHDDDRKALDNAARNQLATNWTAPAAPGRAPRSTAPDPGFQPPELHQTIAKLREHPAVLRFGSERERINHLLAAPPWRTIFLFTLGALGSR